MTKVSYERVGAAAVLTITRPERRNAVDDETAALLLDRFREFEGDEEARVLVLTGEGPEAFCAGADLKAFAERASEFSGDDPQAAIDSWLRSRAGAWRAGSSWRSGATCGSRPSTRASASPSAASVCR